ncbi:MAG: hypothetical protein JWP87_6536 [Labilithrix sp.]|nr:hypothetical protein [Labilithrix sp.]
MPTADAVLLPPPLPSPASSAEERGSARRLDEVGVEAVLGAMIEQKKRASQPSFAAIELPDNVNTDEDDQPPGGRAPTRSEVFLKAR